MLQSFLDCHTQSKLLFEGLKIQQEHPELCEKHQNKYPVIFISMKNLLYENQEKFYFKLAQQVADLCFQFRYLLESSSLSKEQCSWFSLLLEEKANPELLQISLKRLTMLLHQHHGVKPFVLIDEYDAPIHSAFQNHCYEECVSFMRELYGNTLKDNPHLKKAVLTGILRVSKESIFSGLNHLDVLTVLSPDYSQYFGLSEEELKGLLVEYALEEKFEGVKHWYNGYQFGNSTFVYNPWSILNWLKNSLHQFQAYWLNTSSNELIEKLFFAHKDKLQESLFKLLSGGSVSIQPTEHLHFPSLETQCSLVDYFTLLLHSGYVTVSPEVQEEGYCALVIPNKEIQFIFRTILGHWLEQKAPHLPHDLPLIILNAMRAGDLGTFETHFKGLVLQVMSFHDFAKEPENAFHCFTAGFLSWLSHEYQVLSNRETGYGRADILLFPKNTDLFGYIFELKVYKPRKKSPSLSKNSLAREFSLAHKQMEEKNYGAEFQARGIERVKKVGLVFYGKKVWLEEFCHED